jgi:hypothetical protein
VCWKNLFTVVQEEDIVEKMTELGVWEKASKLDSHIVAVTCMLGREDTFGLGFSFGFGLGFGFDFGFCCSGYLLVLILDLVSVLITPLSRLSTDFNLLAAPHCGDGQALRLPADLPQGKLHVPAPRDRVLLLGARGARGHKRRAPR